MATRATRSASRKARHAEAVATGPLGALSHDELGVIFDGLADPLQPVVAVALSSTCLGLRTPLAAALEVLQERHARVVALFRKALVRQSQYGEFLPPVTPMTCAEIGRAPLMVWANEVSFISGEVQVPRPLTEHAEMATLGMLLHKYLPNVTRLVLIGNLAVDDAGMQALCEGLGRGDAPSLRELNLCGSSFGPAGAEALASALSRGAMPNLEKMFLPWVQNLGDQGVAALATPLRKLPGLKSLFMNSCGIGDAGVASLLNNLGKDDFKALEELGLGMNPVTLRSCAVLVAALDSDALPRAAFIPAAFMSTPGMQFCFDDEAAHAALVAALARAQERREATA